MVGLNMAGLLGDGFEDPRSAAVMALAGGLLQGNMGGGLIGANAAYGNSQNDAMKRQYLMAQMQEVESQRQMQMAKAQQMQAEQQRQAQIQRAIPGLFRQPGMTGGQAVPKEMGGVPMFSQPVGAAPMQPTPGGFDVQEALRLGMHPDEINKYAGLQNIGRPKATRQMEVDDGGGGKRIALVDDYGQEVAGFNGYTAPVQVNQGDKVSFVKPNAGMSLPVGMSPSERDASARGWAGIGIQRDQAGAGKAPAGYRFKPDGSLEAIPGGPADIKAGELGAKADARAKGAIAQADSVLQEVRDAKGMVGLNTAGVGGVLSNVPATEARNLSSKLLTIKANLGFDRLQQMRDQSPTGGALGSVAQQELAALQATVASLDQMQSPAQLTSALDKIERHYSKWRDTVQQANGGTGGATGDFDAPKGPTPKAPPKPMVGMVRNGYRFKGGDPADKNSWEKN
jgi:hypothetical protein